MTRGQRLALEAGGVILIVAGMALINVAISLIVGGLFLIMASQYDGSTDDASNR